MMRDVTVSRFRVTPGATLDGTERSALGWLALYGGELDAEGSGQQASGAYKCRMAGLDEIKTVASTVPANGDVNPYGVAVVPHSRGRLGRGDVLVSTFNNAASVTNPGGLQGLVSAAMRS